MCVFASFRNIPQSSPLSWSFFSGSSHFFALQSTRAWTSASSFHVFSFFFHIITAPIPPGEYPLNHQLYLWGLRQACHIRTQDASQAGGRMQEAKWIACLKMTKCGVQMVSQFPSHQVICVFYDCMSVPRVISGILTNNGLCTTNSCQYINLSSPQFKGFTPIGSAPTLQPFAGICDNLHKLAVTSNWRLQTRDPLGQKDLGLNRSKMRTNNNSSGRNQSRSPSDFKRAGIVPCGILWSLLFKIWANACLPKQLFTPLTKIRGRWESKSLRVYLLLNCVRGIELALAKSHVATTATVGCDMIDPNDS